MTSSARDSTFAAARSAPTASSCVRSAWKPRIRQSLGNSRRPRSALDRRSRNRASHRLGRRDSGIRRTSSSIFASAAAAAEANRCSASCSCPLARRKLASITKIGSGSSDQRGTPKSISAVARHP